MPYRYELDVSPVLVTLRASGSVDQAERLAVFDHVREDPKWTPSLPVLIDVREATLGPGAGQGTAIANVIQRQLAGHQVAILVATTDMFGVARQIGFLTDGQVAAFTECSAALAWLKVPETSRATS